MLFSEKFGITVGPDDDWFDPVLHVDTRLFIDPFLIYADERGPFEGSHAEVLAFFEAMFRQVAQSGGDKHSPSYRTTIADLNFPEVPEFCLGYTGKGTGGSGAGGELAKGTAAAIWQATQKGLHNLRHFELVAILRENIGRDRISDTTASILRHRFAAYTKEVCDRHGIRDRVPFRYPRGRYSHELAQWVPLKVELPKNPFSGKAVLLAPRDYLRELPTLNADDFWDYYITREDQALRDRMNYDISKRMPKREIVDLAWSHLDAVDRYTTQREQDAPRPYDFERDAHGIVSWYEPTKAFAHAHPFACDATTSDGLRDLLNKVVDGFADFIEDDGWRLMWSRGMPRREEAAQLLFLGIATTYLAMTGVAVDAADNLGKKPFVLKSGAGASLHGQVEVKLAKNGRFRNTLASASPRYGPVDELDASFICVVELSDRDAERVRELRAALATFEPDGRPTTKFINASWEFHGGTVTPTNIVIQTGDNSPVHMGDQMGDKFHIEGPVTGSAVGRGAVVWARDIAEFKEAVSKAAVDDPVKAALTAARDAVEAGNLSESDKADAADTLGKLKEELEKPEKDRGRLKRLWEGLTAISAPAGQFVGGILRGYFGDPPGSV